MAYNVLIVNDPDSGHQLDSDVSTTILASDLSDEIPTSAGAVTQGTDKTTGVTLSKKTGKITLNAASLAAATIVGFTLTNTLIAATDILVLEHVSGGTSGAYTVNAFPAAGSAVISVRNNTAGSLAEAIVLRFKIVRSADA